MATFGPSDDLRGARFDRADLGGARLVACDLSAVTVRGSELDGTELDSPWLLEGQSLIVNGVDVMPFVDAELDRRFPGRELRRAVDPGGLRRAWAALERTWAITLDRVSAMPAGTVDESVDGEWSFAQTLRHLVMATDTWLGRAIQLRAQPYHRLGLANAGAEGLDLSLFAEPESFAEVLAARADRVAMVREFLGSVSDDVLDEPRANPWAPQHAETVRSCVHTIVEEEWEHHRYAVRDLGTLAGR